MASDVDICNLALLRLGTRSTIAALNEGSTEANACALAYATVRDALLAQHRWRFASRRVVLADLGNAPLGWGYRYAYPSDCLRARAVLPARRLPGQTPTEEASVPFEVAGDQDPAGNPLRVILTNQANAELLYTARITTAAMFDAPFVEALSWMLAAELAATLTGDQGLAASCMQAAAAAVSGARAGDANEAPTVQDRQPEWIAVRRAMARSR